MTASDEAKKALEGVTPGPWSEKLGGDENQVVIDGSGLPVAYYVASANRRFIAWAREGVPALLAEIAAKDAEIARLTAQPSPDVAALEDEIAKLSDLCDCDCNDDDCVRCSHYPAILDQKRAALARVKGGEA